MQTGGCLCGAVRYEVQKPLTGVTYCHCARCRRWHGHVGAYTAVDRDGLRLVEPRGLRWHTGPTGMRRGFCVECGSSVLCDEEGLTKISICPGTLDAPSGVREKAHIYAASRGDYYEIVDGLPRHEEMPGR